MSATNRGSEREELDGYFTPLPCARAICGALTELLPDRPYVLEPSVGRGSFAVAAREILKPSLVVGVDLARRPELDAVQLDEFHQQNFLDYEPSEFFDLVVGNPPFNEAEAHVRHALTMVTPWSGPRGAGVLAFLLRLNFLEGVERVSGFWKEHPPKLIYVLNRRPSFKKTKKPKIDKKTGEVVLSKKTGKPLMVSSSNDATAYGVFVWQSDEAPLEPRVRWLKWQSDAKERKEP